jgi:hypothetical protein
MDPKALDTIDGCDIRFHPVRIWYFVCGINLKCRAKFPSPVLNAFINLRVRTLHSRPAAFLAPPTMVDFLRVSVLALRI